MDNTQTFTFRVSGLKYSHSGAPKRPRYEYVTITNPDAEFRREMAYKTIEYLERNTRGNTQANIFRVDHLSQDVFMKLLEYDVTKSKQVS